MATVVGPPRGKPQEHKGYGAYRQVVVIAPAPDPPIPWMWPSAAQSVRVAELLAPPSDRLVADISSTSRKLSRNQ
jgi:hypothetical protein